jgi:hypothetical protein
LPAVNETPGQTLGLRVKTHQLRRLGIKESSENNKVLRIYWLIEALYRISGRTKDKNESQCLYKIDIKEDCKFSF